MPWLDVKYRKLFYEAQQSFSYFSGSAVCGDEPGIWTKLFSQQQQAALCVGGSGLFIHLCCPANAFYRNLVELLNFFLFYSPLLFIICF